MNTFLYLRYHKYHSAAIDILSQSAPDPNFISTALNATAILQNIEFGISIRKYLQRKDYAINTVVGNSMLNMYAECGKNEEAISLWKDLRKTRVPQDCYTYSTTLAACAKSAAINDGEEVYAHYRQSDLDMNDVNIHTSLLSLYTKVGNITRAAAVFSQMKDYAKQSKIPLTVVPYDSMLVGYPSFHDSFEKP